MSKRVLLKKRTQKPLVSDDEQFALFTGDISECGNAKLFSTDNKTNRIELKNWTLPNRKDFPKFLNTDFINLTQQNNRHYIKKWNETNKEFNPIVPFKHQKFVSDFLSDNSPYRGLLLYHGLGSGKSGASIMIGEGFKNRKVVILVPASLHTNYADELQTFSEISYRKNFYWCFIKCPVGSQSLETEYINLLEQKGLDKNIIKNLLIEKTISGKQYRGLWMINYSKDVQNYDTLVENDRKEIDKQVKIMFESKYTILHYNSGAYTLTKIFEKLIPNYNIIYSQLFGTKKVSNLNNKDKDTILNYIYDPKNNIPNPFNNKVLIVDEIHNLTSTMTGAGYNGSRLYELIVRATNLKIVFLSGTPVINYAYELALMFNMLRGLTYSYTIPLRNTVGVFNGTELEKSLLKINVIDRVLINNKDKSIEITRTPIGFINKYIKEVNIGVLKSDDNTGNEDWFINHILEELSKIKYQKTGEVVKNTYSIFPDYLVKSDQKTIMVGNSEYIEASKESFNDAYINPDTNDIQNNNHFKNRILGLVSFYNEVSGKHEATGANLFPDKYDASADETTVIMSNVQFIEYAAKREIERELETIKKRRGGKKDSSEKDANYFRVFSRQKGLFVFPPNISRPKPPKKGKQIINNILSDYKFKGTDGKDIIINHDDIEEIYTNLNKILDMNSESVEEQLAKAEKLKEYIGGLSPTNKFIAEKLIEKFQDAYIGSSAKSYKKEVLDIHSFPPADIFTGVEETQTSKIDEDDYALKCREAINKLSREHLTSDGTGINLSKLSPKYALMLENMNKSPGSVFCYSQFRSVEGIEIFARILDFAGYSRINSKSGSDILDIDNSISVGNMVRYEYSNTNWSSYKVLSINEGNNKVMLEGIESEIDIKLVHRCHYALWTGTESPEQRKAVQKLYNSLENMYGQKCLILLTTQSGSEGISLLFVRQVHIMEPYWNNVRIDQVVGRARRIKSHVLLPEQHRNVKVFKYIIKFSEAQKKGLWIDSMTRSEILELKNGEENGFERKDYEAEGDESDPELEDRLIKGFKAYAKDLSKNIMELDVGLSSDEKLDLISKEKEVILGKFLKLIKETAIDCKFNKADNIKSDGKLSSLGCYDIIISEGIFTYDFKSSITANVGDLTVKDYLPKAQQIKLILPYKPSVDSKYSIKVLIIIPPELHSIKDAKTRFNKLSKNHPIYDYYTYYGLNHKIDLIPETLTQIGYIDKSGLNSTFKFTSKEYKESKDDYLKIEECIDELPKFDIQGSSDSEIILWATNVKDCHIKKIRPAPEVEKSGSWTCVCGETYDLSILVCPEDDVTQEEMME